MIHSNKHHDTFVVGFELPPGGTTLVYVDAPEGLNLPPSVDAEFYERHPEILATRWDFSVRAEERVSVSVVRHGIRRCVAERVHGALLADVRLGDVQHGDKVEVSGGGNGAVVFREQRRKL